MAIKKGASALARILFMHFGRKEQFIPPILTDLSFLSLSLHNIGTTYACAYVGNKGIKEIIKIWVLTNL